jgi:hypothetical protein
LDNHSQNPWEEIVSPLSIFLSRESTFKQKLKWYWLSAKQSPPWYPNHEIKKIHNLSLGPWVVTLHLSFCFFQTKLKWCRQCKNGNPKISKLETYANHPIWMMITNNNWNCESWKKNNTHTHNLLETKKNTKCWKDKCKYFHSSLSFATFRIVNTYKIDQPLMSYIRTPHNNNKPPFQCGIKSFFPPTRSHSQ